MQLPDALTGISFQYFLESHPLSLNSDFNALRLGLNVNLDRTRIRTRLFTVQYVVVIDVVVPEG